MTPNQSHVAGLQFALDTHIIGDLRARQQVEEIIQQAKSAPAEPDAELVRQCISQELATWEGDFKGPVHTAMRCLQVRIDAKLASLKGVEE